MKVRRHIYIGRQGGLYEGREDYMKAGRSIGRQGGLYKGREDYRNTGRTI